MIIVYCRTKSIDRYCSYSSGGGASLLCYELATYHGFARATNPTRMGNYIVDGEWSHLSALAGRKVFLFHRSKDLLTIPVSVNDADTQRYKRQSAFVFNIPLGGGLILISNTAHQEAGVAHWIWVIGCKNRFTSKAFSAQHLRESMTKRPGRLGVHKRRTKRD